MLVLAGVSAGVLVSADAKRTQAVRTGLKVVLATGLIAMVVGLIAAVSFTIRDLEDLAEGPDPLAWFLAPPPHQAEEPAWSPDGAHIAFATVRFDSISGLPYSADMCTAAADGSRQRPIAQLAAEPAWSPDGTLIAYESSGHIWLTIPDGAGRGALTSGRSPTWSADGARLAFVAGETVTLINADGSGQRAVTKGDSPDWSPDGSLIAFENAGKVWLIKPDGSELRPLTDGSDPTWAPDGRRLALARGAWHAGDIYSVNLDGTDDRRLTSGDSPAWSPVAERIAFQRGGDIYVIDLNDARELVVVRGADRCGRSAN